MSSGEVKINELSTLKAENTTDADLMLIQNTSDTLSISISELKVVLSSDTKLVLIQDNLTKLISDNKEVTDSEITLIKQTITNYESNISGVNDDITQFKQQMISYGQNISNLALTSTNLTDALNTANASIQSNAESITTISNSLHTVETDLTAITNRVKTLEDGAEDNTTTVAGIQDSLTDYTNTTNNTLEILTAQDGINLEESKAYANEKYDDTMKYIDYYHHNVATPPNFDEPYYAQTELGGYLYPTGTLYHTTDQNWNAANYKIPGTWILRAQNIIDETSSLTEYIFERTI